MGIKGFIRCLLIMALLAPSAGWAVEVHGNLSTQFFSFNNEWLNDQRQLEVDQYLRFSITKIDKAGKFSIYGYGRGSQDFTNGEGLNGRLYYLYGEYRDLFNKVDLSVGRQFVNVSAGSAIIDGAQVNLKNIGPVGFTVFGGRDVIFGLNGEIGDGTNTDLGIAAYLAGFTKTDAEISWFRKWDQGDVARDLLGASFKQYLLNNIKVYGNAQYDLASETFNQVLGGVKYFPLSNLVFTGEYYQSYPIFDTTSIYSVFAVNRYSQGLFQVDYTFNDKVSANAGYTREGYGDGGAANVYHIGAGIHPIEPLRVNIEYDNRTGYYGNVSGVIADATYDINRKAQVAAGIDFDVYRRDSLTGDETARRYWLGGKYRLTQNMAMSGRIQDDVNASYTSDVSGRLVFDYNF
jgi:hypothetical protein